jgi:hypothetical protein
MDTRQTFRDYLGSIKTEGGTQPEIPEEEWFRIRSQGGRERKIRPVDCQEKPLRRIKLPVPQTDTGGRDENSKALG